MASPDQELMEFFNKLAVRGRNPSDAYKDIDRLDWLEQHVLCVSPHMDGTWEWRVAKGVFVRAKTFREAVDKAMELEKEWAKR